MEGKGSWTSAAWLLFLRLSAGQAMMGELRGYADAASFGHWVKRKTKTVVNLEVYTPTFTTIQFRNSRNKFSLSQQIEVASLGKALKML